MGHADALQAPGGASVRSRRHVLHLVLHLAHRELTSAHRFTLLGWLWPLIRQLLQLTVLVFVFSNVLDPGIDNFPAFVFAGLIAWSWFATALGAGTQSILMGRHLVFSPRFPTIALPLVAVAVPFVDLLMALPVLLVLLAVQGGLSATALLFPLLLVLEFGLIAAIVLITSALNVFVRDVTNIVSIATLLLFYLTPIFYGLKSLPPEFHPYLQLNPMTSMVTAIRATLIEGRLPAVGDILRVVVTTVVLGAVGLWVFTRTEPRFVDEL